MKLKTEMAVVTSPPMNAAVLAEDQGWRGWRLFDRRTPRRYRASAPRIRMTGMALNVVESS
jgi:hypothetical protein